MNQRIVMPFAAYRELATFTAPDKKLDTLLCGICVEPGGICIATDRHIMVARRHGGADDWHSSAPTNWIVPVEKAILAAKTNKSHGRLPIWVVADRSDPNSLLITLYAVAASCVSDALELPRDRILAMVPSTLLQGTYPDWRKVMPRHGRNEARKEYRALAEAVARWEQDAPVNDEGLTAAQEALGRVAWYSMARPGFSAALLGRICDAFAVGKHQNRAIILRPGLTDADPAMVEIYGRNDLAIVLAPMARKGDERYETPSWAYTPPTPRPALAAD